MDETSRWRRSSFCNDAGCAEIKIDGDTVSLRNTTRPESTVELTAEEWKALKQGILNGEF